MWDSEIKVRQIYIRMNYYCTLFYFQISFQSSRIYKIIFLMQRLVVVICENFNQPQHHLYDALLTRLEQNWRLLF